MKVSEGLVINSTIVIDLNINMEEKPEDFKKLNKKFLKQLYESKVAEINKIK